MIEKGTLKKFFVAMYAVFWLLFLHVKVFFLSYI